MLSQDYYGIVIKIGDILEDRWGRDYQEIFFQQVDLDREQSGRIISVRLFDSFVIDIYDMILCSHFSIYSLDWGQKIRLQRDWYISEEYVGIESCSMIADQIIIDKMIQQQQVRQRGQQRIDHYFRRI